VPLRNFLTYGDVSEYSLTLSFSLLRMLQRNCGRVHSKRRYSDVSFDISGSVSVQHLGSTNMLARKLID